MAGQSVRERSAVGASGPATLCAAFGAASVAGVAMIWATSALPDFNPAGWVRIPVMALFPIGLLGGLVLGLPGVARRRRAGYVLGLVLCAVSVGVFVWLIAILG